MTDLPEPNAQQNDDEARLLDLAARYFDLWQDNWTAWLAPPADDGESSST